MNVLSEIGPLRQVMVHAPGPEIDIMLPATMHRMLFDDIIYGARGRFEHGRFCAMMRAFDVDVVDSRDVFATALRAQPEAIDALLSALSRTEGIPQETLRYIRRQPLEQQVAALIEGLEHHDSASLGIDTRHGPVPIPNLLFSRDACMVLGNKFVVGSMHHPIRQREPLLIRHALTHHPDLSEPQRLIDFAEQAERVGTELTVRPTLEGGDVLVFHEGIVLIGVSQRTRETAAMALVEALRRDGTFRAAILVHIPAARNVMHLDTIFTRASHSECLVYAPMICHGSPETVSATIMDLTDQHHHGVRYPSLMHALEALGVHLQPMYCGGRTSLRQQAREQWTDGANCFTLRPGVIMLYSRNMGTAAELARHGYELVEVSTLPFDDEGRCLQTFDEDTKYALLLEGHELSRARGGPRCMTMPWLRDPVS